MFDWTRDESMYARFLQWKQRTKMVFKSALRTAGEAAQCEYLKYWLGKEGLPLLERWEKAGKLNTTGDDAPGHKLDTYFDLLEVECKPKANTMLAVMNLWSPKSQQLNQPLNQWITKIHNMVDLCNYPPEAKDRIVRDILISGCSSEKAKDKIIREREDPGLDRIIEILQVEDSAHYSMKNIISTSEVSTTANVHYAKYDSRSKAKPKAKNYNSTGANSTDEKKCFRCGKDFTKGHLKHCKAIGMTCHYCEKKGHLEKVCRKKQKDNSTDSGPKKMHMLSINQYYDEDGNIVDVSAATDTE